MIITQQDLLAQLLRCSSVLWSCYIAFVREWYNISSSTVLDAIAVLRLGLAAAAPSLRNDNSSAGAALLSVISRSRMWAADSWRVGRVSASLSLSWRPCCLPARLPLPLPADRVTTVQYSKLGRSVTSDVRTVSCQWWSSVLVILVPFIYLCIYTVVVVRRNG